MLLGIRQGSQDTLQDALGPAISRTMEGADNNHLAECMPACYYRGMRRTALFLKQSQIRELQALSRKTGAPVAELIRRAIDMYLEKKAKKG
jgi:hypothetical protein